MKSDRILIASFVLLVAAYFLLGHNWKGTAGVTGAFPTASSTIQFCGSATGASALLGFVALVLGFLLLIASVITAILNQMKPS
jgi:hypothetical protein